METLPRDAASAGMSRFDVDGFLAMAEAVAISGLDDPEDSIGNTKSHYLGTLPDADAPEPFPGYRPQGIKAVRRVECAAHAHRAARARAATALASLEARESSSAEEVTAARAKLTALGDAPCWAAPNDEAGFWSQQECAFCCTQRQSAQLGSNECVALSLSGHPIRVTPAGRKTLQSECMLALLQAALRAQAAIAAASRTSVAEPGIS